MIIGIMVSADLNDPFTHHTLPVAGSSTATGVGEKLPMEGEDALRQLNS